MSKLLSPNGALVFIHSVSVSKLQSEDALSWMLGSPSFCEYDSNDFLDAREVPKEDREQYVWLYDKVDLDKDSMTFRFPHDEEVFSEVIYDLERLLDIIQDDLEWFGSPKIYVDPRNASKLRREDAENLKARKRARRSILELLSKVRKEYEGGEG